MSTKQENATLHTATALGGESSVKSGELPPSSALTASKVVASGGGSSSAASNGSAANKFSMYNINSQFKGKSIEPQQKSSSN
jgi:hypothetical protein